MMKAGKAGCSKQPDEDTTDETGEDDKADDNEVQKCNWVPGELKSVLG